MVFHFDTLTRYLKLKTAINRVQTGEGFYLEQKIQQQDETLHTTVEQLHAEYSFHLCLQ